MGDGTVYREAGAFAGWELRDPLGTRVGRVSRVSLARTGRSARVEVAMVPFGTRTVLLPVAGVGVDRENRGISLLGRDRTRIGADGPGRQGR